MTFYKDGVIHWYTIWFWWFLPGCLLFRRQSSIFRPIFGRLTGAVWTGSSMMWSATTPPSRQVNGTIGNEHCTSYIRCQAEGRIGHWWHIIYNIWKPRWPYTQQLPSVDLTYNIWKNTDLTYNIWKNTISHGQINYFYGLNRYLSLPEGKSPLDPIKSH